MSLGLASRAPLAVIRTSSPRLHASHRTHATVLAMSKPTSVKLTYFNIEAAAEKVRLALVLTGTPFEDVRVPFPEWQAMKPTTKYGVLPILEVDGKEMHQSMAQLRYAASLGDGSLSPKDPMDAYKVELMIEMANDFSSAWRPSLYIGMRPWLYGYGDDFEGDVKTAKTKELREKFIAETLPVWMKYFSDAVEEHGGAFAAGPTLTIADCVWYPQLNYFTKGVADFVPGDCLDKFPAVKAYMARVAEVPAIAAWYAAH